MRYRNTLVTGSTGFLGNRFIEKIKNEEPILISRSNNEDKNIISCDLLELDDFSPIFLNNNITTLVHLAWYVEHGKFRDSAFNLKWEEQSAKLISTALKFGVKKVIVAGTMEEYSELSSGLLDEKAPTKPASLYSQSKLNLLQKIQKMKNIFEFKFVWGRIFNLYGEGEPKNKLIPSILRQLQLLGPTSCFPLKQKLDLVNVDDAADALVTLMNSNKDGVFNICSGKKRLVEEVIWIIADRFKIDPTNLIEIGNIEHFDLYRAGNNMRLRKLGWEPYKSYDLLY